MSDEPCNMRTRPGLKSCLKLTPPITPELSAAPSPCTSGRTSPSLMSDSGSSVGGGDRKTVSFCSDDKLEEVFFVDEWDRTPAAATPKLSYQDILELKQLRINLPYSPPPPRQPFTTSSPSSCKQPFPLSRFATAASHTPSKWKNRSEPHCADVDPAILPYLDAVPIRLLPLLPDSESPPPSPYPEPHPQTPTPTASPEARPTIHPPSEPPQLRMEPKPIIPTSTTTPLPPRRPNFSFLPLLPVEDSPMPAAPIVPPSAPTPPRRKFNMTFVPVNAMPELVPPQNAVTGGTRTEIGIGMGTSSSAAHPVNGPDPVRPDAGQHTSTLAESEGTSLTPTSSSSDTLTMSPPPLSLSLPALPITAESDTDTDNYTDTDAESDAPSTSTVASSLPSPPCDFEDESALEDLKLGTDLVPQGYRAHTQRECEPGSYFPSVGDVPPAEGSPPAHLRVLELSTTHSRAPGRTPPLSVVFPSSNSRHNPSPVLGASASASHPHSSNERDASSLPAVRPCISLPSSLGSVSTSESSLPATPLSMSCSLKRKIMLEALPSPALAPPSPFELEPHNVRCNVVKGAAEKLENIRVSDAQRARSSATAFSAIVGTPRGTPLESPMLTLESVRTSWDNCARASITAASRTALGPSLSRRRLS